MSDIESRYEWRSIKTCPPLTHTALFEADSYKHGICRVKWMENSVIAKCIPISGEPFFLHSTGNRGNYPTVQDTFFVWRPI